MDDFFFVTTIAALLLGAGAAVAYVHQKFTHAAEVAQLRANEQRLVERLQGQEERNLHWRDRVKDWEKLYLEERRQRLAERAHLLIVPTADGGVDYRDVEPITVGAADAAAAEAARRRTEREWGEATTDREPVNISDRDAPPMTRLDTPEAL